MPSLYLFLVLYDVRRRVDMEKRPSAKDATAAVHCSQLYLDLFTDLVPPVN